MGRKQARMLSDSDEQVDEWGKRAEKVGALQGGDLGTEKVYTRKEVPKVQGGTKLKAEDREAKFSWRAWRALERVGSHRSRNLIVFKLFRF